MRNDERAPGRVEMAAWRRPTHQAHPSRAGDRGGAAPATEAEAPTMPATAGGLGTMAKGPRPRPVRAPRQGERRQGRPPTLRRRSLEAADPPMGRPDPATPTPDLAPDDRVVDRKPTGEQRQATRGAGRLPGRLVGPGPSVNGPVIWRTPWLRVARRAT
jgi:hypothetical protein